jgi:hypothetical protein
MHTAKSELASMLENLPDDSSLEDVQYQLYVLEKVKRGVERTESEGTLSHTEAKQRPGKWLDN